MLSEDTVIEPTIMQFTKLLEDMTRHLKSLYIKAYINKRPVSRVFVDGGVILYVIPIITLKKLCRSKSELISTSMKMINFIGEVKNTIGVLVADIIVGSKTLTSTFFVMDTKPTYSVLLRRDYIHSSQSIPLTFHQLLMFWDQGKVEIVLVDNNPFSVDITIVESIFYSTQVKPIMVIEEFEKGSVKTCDLTNQGFRWKLQSTQANPQPIIQLIDEP